MEYRLLKTEELTPRLFARFHRQQEITHSWRREAGHWELHRDPRIIEDWGKEQLDFICHCLGHTLAQGGMVAGAFADGALKGIVAVEAVPLGSRGQYREIPFLQISRDFRGQGIGRRLFEMARAFAAAQGGQMLYISSQPSLQTQAFYARMGCVDATEPSPAHVARGPFDRQLECRVS